MRRKLLRALKVRELIVDRLKAGATTLEGGQHDRSTELKLGAVKFLEIAEDDRTDRLDRVRTTGLLTARAGWSARIHCS